MIIDDLIGPEGLYKGRIFPGCRTDNVGSAAMGELSDKHTHCAGSSVNQDSFALFYLEALEQALPCSKRGYGDARRFKMAQGPWFQRQRARRSDTKLRLCAVGKPIVHSVNGFSD